MSKQKNQIVFKTCEEAAETMGQLYRVQGSYEAALRLSVDAVPDLVAAQDEAQEQQIESLLAGALDDQDGLMLAADALDEATAALEAAYQEQKTNEMLLLALRGRMVSVHQAQHRVVALELGKQADAADRELVVRVAKLTKLLDQLQEFEGAVPPANRNPETRAGFCVVGIEPGTGLTEALAQRIQLLRSSAAQVKAGGHAFTERNMYTGDRQIGRELWGAWRTWKPMPVLTAETLKAEKIAAKEQASIDARAAAKADRRQREKASEAREKARAAATAEGMKTGDFTEAKRLRDPALVKAQEEA